MCSYSTALRGYMGAASLCALCAWLSATRLVIDALLVLLPANRHNVVVQVSLADLARPRTRRRAVSPAGSGAVRQRLAERMRRALIWAPSDFSDDEHGCGSRKEGKLVWMLELGLTNSNS